MPVTPCSFRTHFPEFTDATAYPDGRINFWLSVGDRLLQTKRWQDMKDHGLALFTAHHLVLQARDVRAAAVGGIPGDKTGVVASKAVDKVNISYDNASTVDPRDGHWGLTSYGLQFRRLSNIAGMGGLQAVGAGAVGPALGTWAGGWPTGCG